MGRLGCWGINKNEYSVQRNEGDVSLPWELNYLSMKVRYLRYLKYHP